MTSTVRRTCPALPRQNNLQNETSLHEQAPLVPAVSVFVYFSFGLCYAGIFTVEQLKGLDPEELYRLDCLRKGYQEDRCQLYVYRLAVYYAETPDPDPDRLRWWLWKDPPDL